SENVNHIVYILNQFLQASYVDNEEESTADFCESVKLHSSIETGLFAAHEGSASYAA
ncbi:hypothetical protein KI387_021025, partial [Taxus chinensis]